MKKFIKATKKYLPDLLVICGVTYLTNWLYDGESAFGVFLIIIGVITAIRRYIIKK